MTRRVLIVEDNTVNQTLNTKFAELAGFESVVVSHGAAALDLLHEETFDLILMDLRMPILDGYETSEFILDYQKRGEMETTPIIAVTADATPATKEKCLNMGMVDYIAKPVTLKNFQEIVDRWVKD